MGPDRLESIIFDITEKKIENLPSRLIIGSSLLLTVVCFLPLVIDHNPGYKS